ncbi:wd40 repeat-containing protein, partial [Leptolyngbya sp. Heron Island J]|uniref:AAA-like domain-containing protein n=1 Tax=Leptolyngbya sp. Heron Island J TaxID=1385935 RepID=UPI0003B9C09D
MSHSSFGATDVFQTGGSLAADASTYVERAADDALYERIVAREFCYVLNSRQMGKSSLRVRTMQRLQAEGYGCAAIDITRIGSQQVDASRWYAGLIRSLASSFEATQPINLRQWLREHEYLTPVQQLGEFIESVLLVEITDPIVIFIDEIDSVLSLNFPTDDLFTFLRACYNQRVDNSAYKRLTFVLLGVATPTDLVQDKTRTPFNVGYPIELQGLSFERAQPLIAALSTHVANPDDVVQRILTWTEGQPFLTQKLCQLVSSHSESGVSLPPETLDEIVQQRIISNWEAQDDQDHLRTIQARLLQDDNKMGLLLGVYQQILQQGSLPYDSSPEHMELRLSGLVVAHQGQLKVYNQIYRNVFNEDWVNRALDRLRPYAESISGWLAADRQDESRLLRGRALADAQAWAIGKSLSTQDYEFLAASRELDVQEMQVALVAQQEANELLEATNKKVRNRLGISFIGSATVIFLALVGGGVALRTLASARADTAEAKQAESTARQAVTSARRAEATAKQAEATAKQAVDAAEAELETIEAKAQQELTAANKQVSEAQQLVAQARTEQEQANAAAATARAARVQAEADIVQANQDLARTQVGVELERRSANLLRYQPERFFEIEILLEALELGQALRNQVPENLRNKEQPKLKNYPAVSPILSLRQAVNQVMQVNKLQGGFPRFSDNGQRISTYSSSDNTSWVHSQDGQKLFSLQGHFLNFSEDGQRILTSSLSDNTSWVYSQDGQELATLQGHSPSFSEDGQRILTSSPSDNTSWVYSQDGQELATLQGRSP